MPKRLHTTRWLEVTSLLLAVVGAQRAALAQENLPDPSLLIVRSATTANGGIEREWEYHKPGNTQKPQPKFTPISKFAGGSGYCTPPSVPHYYGYDTGGCFRSSNCFAGSRSCGCR